MSRGRDERAGGRSLPARVDPRAGRPSHDRPRRAPEPDDRRGRAGGPRGRAPRRNPAVAVVRVVAAVLAVAVLGASGWGWYLGRVADAAVTRTDAIPDDGNTDAGGAPEATNLLLVGSDSRADLTPRQLAELNAGVDSGINTDTMILVHVPADGSSAAFVSLPRDSYVEIPGHGTDKLNAAYARGYTAVDAAAPEAQKRAGGARLLVQTISGFSGLRIDHYAEVDLLGFFNLTSVVGGVTVNLCHAVEDRQFSGAVFPAGEQTIEGVEALRFVRQRQGVRPDGSPALPRGDLDRIVRQQVFIGGMLRKMVSRDVLLDPGKQRDLVEAASESLTVDEDLGILDLAQQMLSVTAGDIEFQTVPVADPNARDEQGRSIVKLADPATLRGFFADLSPEPEPEPPAEAAPETVAPSEVSVAVFNGSGVPGVAGEATTALEGAGFAVVTTANADRADYPRTTIRHAAGDEALAATLAAQVPGAATEVRDDATAGTVQLIIGADFEGIGRPTARPARSPGAGAERPRTAADTGCIN